MTPAARLFEESVTIRRIMAFVFHLTGILGAYYCAFQLRFDFDVVDWRWEVFRQTLPWIIASNVSCILIFRLYQGLWRFFTLRDCLISAVAFGVAAVFSAVSVYIIRGNSYELYPRSVLVITFLLLLLWEIGGRGLVRLLKESALRRGPDLSSGKRLLLVGDPEEADALLRGVQKHASDLGRVVGLVSDKRKDHGSKLRGVPIFSGIESVGNLVETLNVSTILFLPPFTGPARIRSVIDDLSERKIVCDYRVIPSLDELASGKLSVSGIRRVAIEDLLPRVPYKIELNRLSETIRGKRILVTGAGGSIGSEICRQLLVYNPEVIVLFEISEYHLFKIEREIMELIEDGGVRIIACAGDVRRPDHLRSAIRRAGGIDLFYHAAAYKHVDLMERNVVACFQNNVIGTQIAASVAEEEGVADFVLISTDKAVRPTSLMGATKRLAERVLIERPERGTSCKAVRFGNVLGSNGSVVPIFRDQIAKGGPVTVTSPDVTRFFMTIPEAVELVLAAGAVKEDRRIFVLEMGEAVKIDSMARRMIELSGLIPDVDIKVVYTGLKQGEKEYEELLTDDENVVRTDLDRIWVVKKERREDIAAVDFGFLLELIDEGNESGLREYAHELISGSKLFENLKTCDR